MAYNLEIVHLDQSGTPTLQAIGTLLGFPTSFRYFLSSMWYCLGQDGNARTVNWNNFPFGILATINQITVQFRTGIGPYWFIGTYNYNSVGPIVNLLVSVDSVAGIVQTYANDVPLSLASGGLTTTPPAAFSINTSDMDWQLNSAGAPPGAGIADLFTAPPASFFDLSVVANRRKFINADLSPVDILSNGSGPLGAQPQIYLTARSGVAGNFSNNNGFGGSIPLYPGVSPLTFLPAGTCLALWPPPPLELTNAELFFAPGAAFVDLSVAANRRKFVSAGGGAEWLGWTGELPLGAKPPVYLSAAFGNASSFAQNKGTAGPFGISGSIAFAGSGPPCTTFTVPAGIIPYPPGSDPKILLSTSDDGGETWSTLKKPRSLGQIGKYLTRVRWLKMGQFRQRLVRLEISEPVRVNIVGFYWDGSEGMG